MMATATATSTATVVGIGAAKRPSLSSSSSSFYSDNITDRLFLFASNATDRQASPSPIIANARRSSSSSSSPSLSPSSSSSSLTSRGRGGVRALKEGVAGTVVSVPLQFNGFDGPVGDDSELELELEQELDYSIEALLLLQKSMLESQWNLCFDPNPNKSSTKKIPVTCSGISARQRRRLNSKNKNSNNRKMRGRVFNAMSESQLLHGGGSSKRGYVKGVVSEELLSHSQVVRLSNKLKAGLSLEQHKSRLKQRLGCEPSVEQLASSLKMSRVELQSKLMECSMAREKLTMSNVRLVMSIAQRYDNMGAEMSDLVQGGLIGLLRGIEKFDSSRGFKISTYVYWWIRQGVSRALVENSRTLRLPNHLHERLGLIRNAKVRLEEKGISPTIDRIAESLNMSQQKVRNATEAISKVFSLDRDAFPSLNGLPGETHHSYIADSCMENNPWHGVDDQALRDEVNRLINATLSKREREIIRLYFGLDNESLTWEDISKRIGLSRERVRQLGLVALEKLKHVARKRKMEAMLMKH